MRYRISLLQTLIRVPNQQLLFEYVIGHWDGCFFYAQNTMTKGDFCYDSRNKKTI